MRDAPNEALDYGDHRGRIELRTALRDYLARVRGVRVTAERIVITQGFTQGLDLVARTLRARGATSIGFETPSPPTEWEIVRASDLELEPVPIDDDGLRTDALEGVRAAAVVVTPAHQFPTGAVMTAERRAEFVTWARRHRRFIIEDDYDAEFRYDRNGIGAIQGLDPSRVIHIGTASKTLAPGVRLGWMSVPDELVDEIRTLKNATDSGSPVFSQTGDGRIAAQRGLRPPCRPCPPGLPAATGCDRGLARPPPAAPGGLRRRGRACTSCCGCPMASMTRRWRATQRSAGSGSCRSRRWPSMDAASPDSCWATAASSRPASTTRSPPSRRAFPPRGSAVDRCARPRPRPRTTRRGSCPARSGSRPRADRSRPSVRLRPRR